MHISNAFTIIFVIKKMKQKYFYEMGKIYLYNLKKYLTLIQQWTKLQAKKKFKISFKKKGHWKRSFTEIYLDADQNEDRNSQGGSLL